MKNNREEMFEKSSCKRKIENRMKILIVLYFEGNCKLVRFMK